MNRGQESEEGRGKRPKSGACGGGPCTSPSPKSGDITNIVLNVVDNLLSTTFKKIGNAVSFLPNHCANVVLNFAMKVMYSAKIYMFNAIKLIDNSMINITNA